MRVYIGVDFEGISGIVSGRQVTKGNPEFEVALDLMHSDVNAAIAGAAAGGADEIIVADTHDSFLNLSPARIDSRATLLSGTGRLLSMATGIEGSDLVTFVGYHAMAGTTGATLDHSYSDRVFGVYLNGVAVGESAINGVVATHFGIPVGFLSGDTKACEQAHAWFGDIETVAVKKAENRFSARCLPLEQTRVAIAEGMQRAVKRAGEFKPVRIPLPATFAVDFMTSNMADKAERYPGAVREGRRVSVTSDDLLTAFRGLMVILDLGYGELF